MHFLGAFACGLDCPTNQRHTFYPDGNGYLCETCVFLCGAILDPDVIPVRYQLPLSDNDEPTEWDEDARERTRAEKRRGMKMLPDEWLLEKEGEDDSVKQEGKVQDMYILAGSKID